MARRRSAEERELDLAVEAAVALGAEQGLRPPDRSGYQLQHPEWLHEAVTAALPEHLGYGRVEGVLVQRGPRSTGGYRLVTEREGSGPAYAARHKHTLFVGGLDNIYPAVLRARVRRVLLEARERERAAEALRAEAPTRLPREEAADGEGHGGGARRPQRGDQRGR